MRFLYDAPMSNIWRTLLQQGGPEIQTAFSLMTEGSQTRTSRIRRAYIRDLFYEAGLVFLMRNRL